METSQILLIAVKLALGGLAAILAIAVWARTREAAWLFTVLGILALYTETIYRILEILGMGLDIPIFGSMQIPDLVLTVLPPVFFITAFIFKLAR
ncbi:MAG: hypothetical protein LBC77_02030 [Spirochaetaceae bacterium]|jgi:hypothetical protein|nr:hypothetical protein [Spirochaetaceae bacterium]